MPASKHMLLAPMKGYSEVTAYASQPDGSSPIALNVSLLDPSTSRFRPAQRAGDGLFDAYNFATGATISAPIVVIPANGVNATAGTPINLPVRGCYQVTATSPTMNLDLYVTGGSCNQQTIQVGGQPNSGGATTGSIIVTPDSGNPYSIPWTQGGGSTSSPITDNTRPYLQIVDCTTKAFLNAWIHQDVLAVYNALPALLDNKVGSIYNGQCLQVSGRRDRLADIPLFAPGGGAWPNGEGIRAQTDFTVLPACSSCGGAGGFCVYPFVCTYNCLTLAWSSVTAEAATCATQSTYPAYNSWVFTGDTSGPTRTFHYYSTASVACVSSASCTTTPATPAAPTGDPFSIDIRASCSSPDTLTVRVYLTAGSVLEGTAVMAKDPNREGNCLGIPPTAPCYDTANPGGSVSGLLLQVYACYRPLAYAPYGQNADSFELTIIFTGGGASYTIVLWKATTTPDYVPIGNYFGTVTFPGSILDPTLFNANVALV